MLRLGRVWDFLLGDDGRPTPRSARRPALGVERMEDRVVPDATPTVFLPESTGYGPLPTPVIPSGIGYGTEAETGQLRYWWSTKFTKGDHAWQYGYSVAVDYALTRYPAANAAPAVQVSQTVRNWFTETQGGQTVGSKEGTAVSAPDGEAAAGRLVEVRGGRGYADPLYPVAPPDGWDSMTVSESLVDRVTGRVNGSGLSYAYSTVTRAAWGNEVTVTAGAVGPVVTDKTYGRALTEFTASDWAVDPSRDRRGSYTADNWADQWFDRTATTRSTGDGRADVTVTGSRNGVGGSKFDQVSYFGRPSDGA